MKLKYSPTLFKNSTQVSSLYWVDKSVSFKIPFTRKTILPFTFKKSHVGRSLGSPLYTPRCREVANYFKVFFKELHSTFKFQSILSVISSFEIGRRGILSITKSFNGVTYRSSYSSYFLFAFVFADSKILLPKFQSVFSYTYLGYLPINCGINYILPLFTSTVRMVKAFGSKASILSYNDITSNYAVRLPSGLVSFFFILTKATRLFTIVKGLPSPSDKRAGFSNKKGFRPKVRGVAKNPVDHPHGGRTKSIRLPLTPWGLVTKKKN